MKDVQLLGNLTVDYVMECASLQPGKNNIVTSRKCRMGGLANMLPALQGLDIGISASVGEDWSEWPFADLPGHPRLEYRAGPSSLSHIFIHDGERTSFTDWGTGVQGEGLEAVEAKWTHIAYLDVMEGLNVKEIKKASKGLVSADVCLCDPSRDAIARVIESAEALDLLFLSEGEMKGFERHLGLDPYSTMIERVQELRDFSGVKQVVFHWRDGAIVSTEGGTWVSPEWIRPTFRGDTIGAGDLFAGCVIKGMLDHGDLRGAVNSAHSSVGELLMKRGEE